MFVFVSRMKKSLAILSLCFLSANTFAATASEGYLKVIAENTGAAVLAINAAATTWFANLAATDPTPTTSLMGASLLNFNSSLMQGLTPPLMMFPSANIDLFGANTVTPATLNFANDLLYSTLLGQPLFQPDPRMMQGGLLQPGSAPNSPYNYLKNASAVNLPHYIPQEGWQGSKANKDKYSAFYSTVMSVESFDFYTMLGLYADDLGNKGSALTTAQTTLVDQARNPTWFATIASESVAVVLRQILMYQSESFLVLTQMLQLERQLLTAQIMNNTLMILNNQNNESAMLQLASGAEARM